EASGATLKLRKGSEGMKTLIQRGLRAELELQSFVTGQVGIALAFHPDTPVRLTGLSPDYPEMPTVASGMEKLTRTLETLPIDEMAEAAQSIRVLADYLERNPSSLVFGKGRVSK